MKLASELDEYWLLALSLTELVISFYLKRYGTTLGKSALIGSLPGSSEYILALVEPGGPAEPNKLGCVDPRGVMLYSSSEAE